MGDLPGGRGGAFCRPFYSNRERVSTSPAGGKRRPGAGRGRRRGEITRVPPIVSPTGAVQRTNPTFSLEKIGPAAGQFVPDSVWRRRHLSTPSAGRDEDVRAAPSSLGAG